MAGITVHGIVLRRQNSGESDRRLTILCEELGKVDVIARGARKQGSRLAGISEPLSVSVLEVADGKRNRFVTQGQPIHTFRQLRQDYDRIALAFRYLELLVAVLPWEEPAPEAYSLALHGLSAIDTHLKPKVAAVWAEVKLLEMAGFLPSFDTCVVSGEPLAEADGFISPNSGGYLKREFAGECPDRYLVRLEVLVGLARLVALTAPPDNLKLAEDCLIALGPIWTHVAESALPATRELQNRLLQERTSCT